MMNTNLAFHASIGIETKFTLAIVALASLTCLGCGTDAAGSGKTGGAGREESAETPAAPRGTNVCSLATEQVMAKCPGEAPQLLGTCDAYPSCVAVCILNHLCDGAATSTCAAGCNSTSSPSGGSPAASSSVGGSSGTSGSSSTGSTGFPQCPGIASSLCRCYGNGVAKATCTARQTDTCTTFFGTCPKRAAAYYACAKNSIDCSNGDSFNACETSTANRSCN